MACFLRTHFMQSLERYRELLSLFVNNSAYAAQLGLACDRKSAQEFAETLLRVTCAGEEWGEDGERRLVVVMARMIEEEVANTPDDLLGSVLRGNNALSKLEGEFVRRVASDWLRQTLRSVMSMVVSDAGYYEVDPARVQMGLGKSRAEDVEAVCAVGRDAVLALANAVLASVCSKASIDRMPLALRLLASKTHEAAKQRGVDDPLAVAGGFLWLRVLSPALTSPGAAGLLSDPSTPLLDNQKRRVLLATKLLQGASNNVEFGKKEAHMQQFNPFIRTASDYIKLFLQRVCDVAPATLVRLTTDDPDAPSRFEDVEALRAIDVPTLLSMHRLCVTHAEKMLAALARRGLMGKNGTRLSKVVAQLGPAPPPETNPLLDDEAAGGGVAAGGGGGGGGAGSAGVSSSAVGGGDEEGAEAGKPIYWHETTMFVIARRLRGELISDNASAMVELVLEAMRAGTCHQRSYDVVFDMTYFAPTPSLVAIFQTGSVLYKALPYDMRKNLRLGVVLHPDRVARSLMQFGQALASEKARKKLTVCFSWHDLDRLVPGAAASLPEESKSHVLESFSVVKINQAGKRQRRLVKLTPRSLLNIDPKGPRVQNERAIALVEKLELRDETRVQLRFVDPEQAKAREWNEQTVEQFAEKIVHGSGGMLTRLGSKVKKATHHEKDLLEREYEFSSRAQRDEFVLDFLKLGLTIQQAAGQTHLLPHFFVVNKTGSIGQAQVRVWLLTQDSILNLDTSLKMHSEIGLASILSVKPDPDHGDTVQLRLLDREELLVVRTEWRDSLVAALTDAMPRAKFRQTSDSLESLMSDVAFKATGGVTIGGDRPKPPLNKAGSRAGLLDGSSSGAPRPGSSRAPVASMTQSDGRSGNGSSKRPPPIVGAGRGGNEDEPRAPSPRIGTRLSSKNTAPEEVLAAKPPSPRIGTRGGAAPAAGAADEPVPAPRQRSVVSPRPGNRTLPGMGEVSPRAKP